MFCLQCGAEAQARAVTCLVCGHDLGRSSADLHSSAVMAESSLQSSAGRDTPPPPTSAAGRPVPTSVHIRAGDLDQPGLPQDATGRALLIVILALMADLFLPWSVVSGQHQTLPVQTGVAIALLVGLAALPLVHPNLRRHPAIAATPLAVGGIALGIGLASWMNVGSSSEAGRAGPDFGLFIFLVGALLVIVIGYYLFLDSARAALPGTADTETAPTKPRVAEPGQSYQVASPAAADADSADKTISTNNPRVTSMREIPLPGSDSWNHTMDPPSFVRPRAGSIRRSNR